MNDTTETTASRTDDEYENLHCKECDWSARNKDRIKVLEAGFYHVIGQGHDVERQDEIEDEFNL